MARLISRKQVEEIKDFIRDTSFAQNVTISGSLLVSESFNMGSDPDIKSTITGSVELTGSLTIDGPLNVIGDQALNATASFSLESLDTQLFGGIKAEDFGAMDATIYVSSTSGNDKNDGRTQQFPVRTVKRAAELATSGDDGRFGLPTGSLFTGFRIEVSAGTYLEENPIELPKNTTVWGAGLRVTKIVAKNENEDLFWVNSGCYLSEMTFAGLRVFPSVDNSRSGFAIAFAPNSFITTSPYVQNCSMISNQENSFLEKYEAIPAGGGGLNVDGNIIHPDSPLASMVLDAYTQIAPNGVGCQVVGRGFIQLVSFFTNFSAYSVKVLQGGQAVLLNSNTSFGDFGMYASGSRFITGSGGNLEAFNRVRDNYTIIIDTIEDGLTAIPEFVPNTNAGIKVTDELQQFSSNNSSDVVAEQAKSEYRLVSNIVSSGINNIPSLLAKSATRGYNTGSVWNISNGTQTTGSTSATSTELNIIDDRFDKVKQVLSLGARATASYTLVDNIEGLVKVGSNNPYTGSDTTSQTEVDTINRNFNTILQIVEYGLNNEDYPLPALTSSNAANIKVTETPQYNTDISSSAEVANKVSSSFATVFRILELGSDYAPAIVQSSSFENPSIDYQNGYDTLIGNLSFIQNETIAYLSSSWSESDYNEETCKRDIGFIVNGAAHDLLYGGNEESVLNGNFYYLYPSEATASQKQETLDAIRYAGGLAESLVGDITYVEPSINVENGYDLLVNNKSFIQNEVISFVSSSWRGFEYDEVKCKRDVGHVINAVATDLRYGGNERSRIAGEFYYLYPSTATTTQLLPTLDGIEWARDLSKKLVVKDTFVTASAIIQSTYDLIVENRSLIQEETVNFIDTQFPNLVYLRDKCKRDTGYIVDAVATDLYYGGNQKSVRAGLYYNEVPSKVNGDQLNETVDGISYAKSFIDKVIVNEIVESPQVINNTYARVRAGNILQYVSSSISGSETERVKVSSSFGIVEDIIKQGEDSLLSAIAGNTPNFNWRLDEPKLVSNTTLITSSISASSAQVQSISSSFEIVTKIIESGSSITTDKTIGSASNGLPISQVGIPKDSYGDNLITTTIGTKLPNDIVAVSNVNDNIKFTNNSQYTSSISASITIASEISESFRTVIDIVEYGISGSKEISGSANSSSYFEVITLPNDSTAFYINDDQLKYFDGREGWRLGGEDTGSFLGSKKDPTLTLVRNEMYNFSINDLGFEDTTINAPFLIKTKPTAGTTYDVYESIGLINNGITFGTITFTPLADTPDTLYYVNPTNVSASGVINIVDSLPLSSEQEYVYVPTRGEFEKVVNTKDNIKITTDSQYTSSLDASVSDRNIVSGGFSTIVGILKSGVDSFTPTSATYNPADGEFVMTISQHGLDVGDRIYLKPESFVFTCDMDGNRTEHKLPSVGQPAYNKQLTINSITDNTISVNVGKSGPNINFNTTTASYDPSTGDFVATVGKHSLSVGEGIILSPESFAFTCDMDNDQSVKSYPRVGIDPFAVRSIPITSVTDTTLTFNVGASGPNKYFTPTSASYNALTGDMIVTVGQHGLGVGRSVVLEDESFAFTCDQDSDATIHSYPRPGSDPYAGKSIEIKSVGNTQHTPTDAPYNASTGIVTLTIAGHGFSNGDYVKVDDGALIYTCVLDGNTVQKSYPRAGYDYPSGRWLEISNVTTDTFDINIGASSYKSAHTFVSATTGGIRRQTGTFTINVGDGGTASNSLHTFVSASSNAVKHEPQSVHTYVSSSNGAIKHLPQSTHTFVRVNEDSVSTLPILTKNIEGLVKRSDATQFTSSLSGSGNLISKLSSSFETVLDIIEFGTGSTPSTATYDPADGDFVMTIPNHKFRKADSIYLKPESFVFTCEMDDNKTEHKLPSVGQPAYNSKLRIKSVTDNTVTVNVGKSGPNLHFNPTNATYDPATGDFVITTGTHNLSVGEGIILDIESFAFTCDMDDDQSVKSYPRLGIDPYAGRSMIITDVTDTTMTVNVGISGPNKYFTPSDVNYNALTGEMVLTVGQHGLGVSRSVVLENESFAFTCDQDGDSTTHSYPRSGSDPYAEQSIKIISVGTTSHTPTNAPYNPTTGIVTLTIANHGFSNNDYIKVDDGALTYTCVLDGNTTQKSYPRTGIDYPSGRWLQISNVTTNTFEINIGSSSYTGAHTFVSATTNGIKRQDGTFTINVGDGGSASGSIHTFVSASTNAVKHEPQSLHTFVSASREAVKHLPQSVHTFVRTIDDSVTVIPPKVENTEEAIAVTTETQFTTSSISASAADISFISESFEIVTRIIEFGSGSYESSSLYGSEVTASSTVAAYNLLKSNIDFIKEETIAYLSSSWSAADYNETSCSRDIAGIVSGAAEDLIHNVYSASVFNGKFYLEYPSQAQGSQLNQTLDGIRYASRVAQKVASNVTFSNPVQDRLDTQTIINNNKEFIKEEGIAFLSASWSDFDYPEETCKRDIVHILDASITDIVYGGNERTINAGVFYWKYPSEATGSQLFPTLDGIEYAGEVAQKVVSGAVFTPPTSEKVNAYNLVLENRDLIQNEVIEYVSSSWNAADYDDVKCKRDTGYIIDAAITDLLYGGNERSIIAGDFYYKYPSQAQGSQLDQTVDGIVHAQRLSDKVMSNTILVNPSIEREGLYQTIEQNRELVQAEVIAYISSSWVGFDYDEAKCSRDVGHILDAVSTDLRYGGNERSVIAGEYYYLYPSEATSVQKTQTIDGIVHAANLVQKLIQNVVLVQPSATKLSIWNTIRDNRTLIQKEVTEYIDYAYPFFTYNREKCRRDVGHILDGVATDFLWGGNQRSIKGGEFYYLFPSEATTVQKDETIDGIMYAKNLLRDIITQQTLLSPSTVSNTDGNIKVTSFEAVTSSIALSGSYQTEVSESYDIVTGIIKTGIESFTPKTATYDPANGDFVMTVPKHNLYSGDSIYLKPESFVFTCDMDGNRTEHKLPSIGQPAYDNRLTIKSTTSDTITVNVGKSGPNVEYNPTTASYDPATGEFVVTVASHSLSVGEGVVMSAESFAFTCDMDNDQSVKSYPRVGIDPYSVRSLPLTDVTDTTMTFNVGASGPNKYFTPVSASYNALSGDMTLTVSESFGLGVGRSVVLENESIAFTCDMDSNATTHSYPRSGSDPYAEQSIKITSVGTTSHSVTDAPYDSATGDVTITIANHNFNNGDYIKLDDNSLTYTCVLDNNTTTKSYPRPNYDYPSGRWLEISNVTTNTFDINIGSSPYVGSHTFVSATTNGLKRQDGTFTINVGDGGSASGSIHTFVSASNRAVKHEPQSVHTFVSASNGALKHLPQSAHTFIRTDRDSVSTLPILTENIEGLIKINDTTQFTSSLSGSGVESAYVTRSVGFINDIIRLGTDDIPFALAKWFDDTLDAPQQLTTGSYVTASGTFVTDTEFGIVSSSFGQIINIIENGVGTFTPTTAAYNPLNGNFIVTIPNHTLDVGEEIYIRPESFVFTCDMDGNKTEHKLPSVGQPAYTNKLEIISKTDDTITVNVGASGPNVEWTPSNATYNPATGDFVITTGTHTLSVGEGIVLDTGSFAFTCDMDNDQSTKSYPRLGIDPYAGRSMKLTSVTDTTMTVNVGVSGPNKYFTPVSASYNALSGDMTLTVSESFGLGVGRSVVLENESFAFTCDQDSDATTHSYPRLGSDPYAEQSIVITSVGKTQHTPTDAPYNSLTGDVIITIANHNFTNGDYIKISDNGLSYTCILDGNKVKKSYPRPNYDYPSGRWLPISDVTTNTFKINIGASSYVGEHTFVSAEQNSIERQTGTFTINVGNAGSASGSLHTFVSASANAVKHEPQSVHTFVSASKAAVKHLPQSVHKFVRTDKNSISVLPAIVNNTESNIKVTNTNQFTSSIVGSITEVNKVKSSIGIIEDILQNGTSVKPTVVKNNSDKNNLIKVTDAVQITSESFGDRLQQRLISSSIAIVTTIVENGTGSLPTVVEYGTPSDSPKTLAAYNLLKDNIEFIQSESIAYLSSSWSTASYNETSCSRDIGAIISGAAEDMLYNANSSSIFNGKFYYDFPSKAQGAQLQQTLDGINYAGRLAESIVRGYTFQTASALVSGSYELIRNNREFIENETIEFLSSSWDGFTYNEITCKRDITHIIDAVSTDLLYGGNERSVNAGDYYYRYPSAAIIGGVPNENKQKDPTVTAVDFVQGFVSEIVSGAIFQTASNEVDYVYDTIRENREFLQAETVAFVNAKYPNFEYNELSCSRDTGFIIDAVATDLRYGGNQRALTAGEFYYRFPSEATDNQLDETTDALIYTKDLIQKLVNKETLFIPTGSLNTDNGIKVTSFSPATGGDITDITILNTISSSFAIVSDAISNGTGSTPTSSNYGAVSTDSDILTTYGLITESVTFIQNEVVEYISSSWVGFDYDDVKCRRDVGFIVNGVAEDLRYGIVSASSVNARFYYQFPSEANGTGSQAQQTIDGINYAAQLTEQIVKGVTFDFPSTQISASVELIRNNREFIQSESISYLSSSWEGFDYVESTCMRDVGHILDAVSTDLLYGGNQRSKIAGEYYYKYPSSATSTQLEPTTTGIKYAGDVASKLVQNEIFVTASAERLAGNKVLLDNKEFIQNEVISYISSSWSTFDYNEDKCKRDTGYILNGVATDFLYGGNERGRVNGEYYYLYPSDATVNFQSNPNGQLNQTIDGINYSARLAEKVLENITFVTASAEVSASAELLRNNRSFVQNETIEFISSSWSNVKYNEDKCRRDTGYIIDAAVTDLVYGGNERSINAGLYYWRYPSRATNAGTPSEQNQLDPTVDGIRFANGTSQNVVQNLPYTTPSAEITNGVQLLRDNTTFIQKETIAYLSSSWSEFEYNEVSCSRDLGYIIDAVATDLTYGGNERAVQAGTFYYYIPSIATTEQKPQTTDGIDFSKGLAEKIIKQQQLVFPAFLNNNGATALRNAKKVLQGKAISYTNAAFPNFIYNEEKCYRDTGFILDAIATDIIYGGNERSIRAAESYYNGIYGSAAVVINEQKKETAETNRYLRTQFQFVARQAPVEEFGSLIITTGHDFSYAGAGVTYKALPPNQGGDGVPDPDKEITEIGGGRVFFTSGNELGDFRIGGGLVIKQASGTLEGRTFSKSLFSLVTPFSLALQD
jgi:NAD-dependent SIR2 family protein deacetylase